MSLSQLLAANADFLPCNSALLDPPSLSGLPVLLGKRPTPRAQQALGSHKQSHCLPHEQTVHDAVSRLDPHEQTVRDAVSRPDPYTWLGTPDSYRERPTAAVFCRVEPSPLVS